MCSLRIADFDGVAERGRRLRDRHRQSNRGEHRFDGFAIEADAGACWGRFVGAKTDGTPLDLAFADCYRFKDGLLWRRKSFFYLPLV